MEGRDRADSSPWFAVNLSLMFPGLGQLYQGQVLRGLGWFTGAIALLLLVFWAYLSPRGQVQIGAGAIGMGVMLWVINLVDAHACALGQQHRHFESFSLSAGTAQPQTPAQKAQQNQNAASLKSDLGFAIFLSNLLPGLGQLQQRQLGMGTFLLLLALFCGTLLAGQLGWSLGLPALSALACLLLGLRQSSSESLPSGPSPSGSSPSRPLPSGQSHSGNWRRRAIELALVIFVGRSLLLATFPAIRQVVEPFSVPSESMFPTLMVGDRILVHKSRRYRPHPGDIVVFRDPNLDNRQEPRFFVKRIVGGPGDRIVVSPGQTQRNEQAIVEAYINEPPRYRWSSGPIPPRHFVVLGDNRNESFDSSRWGLLPQSHIVGRAYRISWPPERSRPLLSRSLAAPDADHRTEYSSATSAEAVLQKRQPTPVWSDTAASPSFSPPS